MTAIVAVTATAAVVVIARSSRVPHARDARPIMTDSVTQLPSGLTVATDHVPGARSVAMGTWVEIGSRDEAAHQAGVSHFLEHLLFKGTATRSASGISRAVDRVGGDINAFTAKEYTAYYCRMPARHADAGIELLGDVLTHSTLTDSDVDFTFA